MTTDNTNTVNGNTEEMQEIEKTAGTDGAESGEPRTFTQREFNDKFNARYRSERKRHEREIAELKEQHEREIAELRESLKANVERAQHLEHDSYQVNKHREELEELRAYKAQRERGDLMQRISEEYGGVPVELMHGETEEELTECARRIAEYANVKRPTVPETKAAGMTPAPDNSGGRASILNIKDRRERLQAIADNRALFGTPDKYVGYDVLGEFIDLE